MGSFKDFIVLTKVWLISVLFAPQLDFYVRSLRVVWRCVNRCELFCSLASQPKWEVCSFIEMKLKSYFLGVSETSCGVNFVHKTGLQRNNLRWGPDESSGVPLTLRAHGYFWVIRWLLKSVYGIKTADSTSPKFMTHIIIEQGWGEGIITPVTFCSSGHPNKDLLSISI